MSFTFTGMFGNYDKTAETIGAGKAGIAYQRRASLTSQDPEGEAHARERRGSSASAASKRRASEAKADRQRAMQRAESHSGYETDKGDSEKKGLEPYEASGGVKIRLGGEWMFDVRAESMLAALRSGAESNWSNDTVPSATANHMQAKETFVDCEQRRNCGLQVVGLTALTINTGSLVQP